MANRWQRMVLVATATLAATTPVVMTPSAVHAAAATVPNGIGTTDLNSVGVTPASLAASLVGSGVTVSNVTFTGAKAQAGALHVTDPAIVGFNDGVILSSGNVADVMGPNTSEGITGDMAGAGDADLNTLIQGWQTVVPTTFDAAVLQFDFVPTASTVYFTYVFGSDEYLEWVNLYDDVFGFFVNGVNCATTPSAQPVSIDSINDTVNPNLYRDNSFANPPANPLNIESDGVSVELICQAAVNPGKVNHMKLAIADTSDQILDSVVMIKAHSLSTTMPESCNDSVDNDHDTLVDMNDDQCVTSTTPAPASASGVGSNFTSPPFTGIEGSPVVLDASALGWVPTADTVRTSWTVTGINGTTGSCMVSPAAAQPVQADGSAAVVTAVCPDDGEYVARIDGWDVEGGGSWDTDVDFFVHNAPPQVSIDNLSSPAAVNLGDPVDLIASVVDPGVNDVLSCTVDWGDGGSTLLSPLDGVCAATHTFSVGGAHVVSVTAIDQAGDAAATAVLVDVQGAPVNTPPTASVASATAVAEGGVVTLAGTASDVDGDPLITSWMLTPGAGTDAGALCVIANASALSTTAVCNDDGTFTATLTVSDGAAAPVTASATRPVTNVAPTVSITSPLTGAKVPVGAVTTVKAAVTDAGTNDVVSCTVAWGDGTANSTGVVSAGVCTATHTFTTASTGRTVVVTAKDDDLATSTASVVVVPVAMPTITSLSPTSGAVGAAVTIAGTNFTGATSVKFNGTAATFTVSSATKITTTVPAGATTGTVVVTTAAGSATSATFTVTVPVPTIGSFTPTSGGVGTAVTVTGTNLTGATSVKVNGLAVSAFTVVSATTVVFGIPVGATIGKITITTPGGTATAKTSITVSGTKAPTVTSFTPGSGAVGAKVTLTGTNLGAALSVSVNGTAAAYTVSSATTIVLTIPAGAKTGKVSVTTAGGTASSSTSLTVL